MPAKLLALILIITLPVIRRWFFFAPAPGGVDLQVDEYNNWGY